MRELSLPAFNDKHSVLFVLEMEDYRSYSDYVKHLEDRVEARY